MATFYNIEQDFLKQFNLPTKWADYDEELDEIYMSQVYPLIMKHFELFPSDYTCEAIQNVSSFKKDKSKKKDKPSQVTKKPKSHTNPFELLMNE